MKAYEFIMRTSTMLSACRARVRGPATECRGSIQATRV